MRIHYSEIEETSPWTTIAEKDPLEVIDVWDYIDQRGLRHYNIGRPIPRAKLLYSDDENEDGSELRNRSTAVTYFHSFPVFYFPLLRPRSEEITIGNYFYVSTILFFINFKNVFNSLSIYYISMVKCRFIFGNQVAIRFKTSEIEWTKFI